MPPSKFAAKKDRLIQTITFYEVVSGEIRVPVQTSAEQRCFKDPRAYNVLVARFRRPDFAEQTEWEQKSTLFTADTGLPFQSAVRANFLEFISTIQGLWDFDGDTLAQMVVATEDILRWDPLFAKTLEMNFMFERGGIGLRHPWLHPEWWAERQQALRDNLPEPARKPYMIHWNGDTAPPPVLAIPETVQSLAQGPSQGPEPPAAAVAEAPTAPAD